MSASNADVLHVAQTQNYVSALGIRGKSSRVIITAILILGVWGYARFGTLVAPNAQESSDTETVGTFLQPTPFIATPGGANLHINERSGPGAEFRIKLQLDRGTRVTGIARVTDTHGAFWILLADGFYAKESVLSRVDQTGGQ